MDQRRKSGKYHFSVILKWCSLKNNSTRWLSTWNKKNVQGNSFIVIQPSSSDLVTGENLLQVQFGSEL